MKLKKVLALLLVVLILSGCAVQEQSIQPELPAQTMDEPLQESLQEAIPNPSDEPSVQPEEKAEQQDEPREDVMNTESPANKPEPEVSPKEEPSKPEEEPSRPEQQPAEPSEPEATTPKDEPSVPVEPNAPIQPPSPEEKAEEKVEEVEKEDDLVPPSEEIVKEPIDEAALISAGLRYAADTYGYEISVGVRDGYYPAYQCVFDTMEEGRNCVKRCVDDTTRALLARPGTQIVVEIDGVLCRARIDITMKNLGDGTYSVTVYYG